MITKIKINKETLEVTTDNCDCFINYVKDNDEFIELEISMPEPEVTYNYTSTIQ